MNYDVFVSYSTQDKLFVDALVNRLECHGIRCWYAPRDIPAGMTWPAAITTAIKTSSLMLLVFSEAANASQEVAKELTLASSHKCLVVPVRIENVSPSPEMEFHLTNKHWLDVHGLEVEAAIVSILETLRRYENIFQRPINSASALAAPQARVVPPPLGNAALPRVFSLWQRIPAKWRMPAMVAACAAASLMLWLAWPAHDPGPQAETPAASAPSSKNTADKPNLTAQAKAGDPEAQYALGVQLNKDKSPDKAFSWLLKAAQQGHRDAQYSLGDMYYSGSGVKKNYQEAAQWYLAAAKNNHTEAQSVIAGMYQQGIGVAKNEAVALSWYQKAANQGNAFACYGLAEMYEYGQGTQQSMPSAFKLYLRAAESGYAPAQYKVGFMYYTGSGIKQNSSEAVRWLRSAAEQKDELALELLGQIRQ